MGAAPALGYLGGFMLCVILLTPIMALFARRRARSAIIFRHLGLIVQQNLPLAPALLSAAYSEIGPTRRILLRLSRRAAMGIPLSRALSMAYPGAPALVLSIVQSAERSGTLPSALRELNQRLSRESEPTTSDAARRWVLYSAILVGFAAVYIGFSLLVFPRFMSTYGAIEKDAALPPSLWVQDILCAGNLMGPPPKTVLGHVFRLLIAGLTVIVPLFVICGLARLRPRRADHFGLAAMLGDFLRWHLWPSRKFAWAVCLARALPTLRLTIAAGWPLSEAMLRASEIDANCFARRCLRRWAERLSRGEDAIAAGRSLHVPEMLLVQMSLGIRDGDLESPLYYAEDYYRSLENRWKQFLIQLLWPLTTAYIGAIVAIVTAAFFLEITSFIDHACASIG